MHRTICSIAFIFALLPLTASADALPKPEIGIKLDSFKPVAAIEAPQTAEVSELEELPVPAQTPATAPSVGYCGDNIYKQFIYSHESGCNTDRWNASGCYGIGQACPASKIAYCGADFACQDAWFTDYANRAYGGWEGAYNAWLSKGWW